MLLSRRRTRWVIAWVLAVPVLAVAYLFAFAARFWMVVRPAMATMLGATVIGSIYAEEAYRRSPAPLRAGAVATLALVLVGPSFSAPASVSAAAPADAVVTAARQYLGSDYRLGAEGPSSFDCSGLIYRAFSDAGELPRIGGMRLLARGYMQYFVSRGRFSTDVADARPGDLIVWNNGEHIGIYVGDGKAISALVNPWGVSIHQLYSIHQEVTQVLLVNWGGGDSGNPGPGGDGNPNGGNNQGNDNNSGGVGNSITGPSLANPGNNPSGNNSGGDNDGGTPNASGQDALALGTMNLRAAADPSGRIIGWIGRGGTFTIIAQGNSPAGFLWYKIQTKSGKQGWVYSRWVKPLD